MAIEKSSFMGVFVPFLGDFLSICLITYIVMGVGSFRPLSWGLSFNLPVFHALSAGLSQAFSSPFLGTFFQSQCDDFVRRFLIVFVPFLGDFLSIQSVL